ncbi:MAG TPA: AAA family ATPase, partial [Acidimicrobiales bacterium]|nr:AAA family ATPase [Acidimicrobiales bacterium]
MTALGAVLFTDLVDSTEMRTRLGDDVADGIRRQHDSLLTEAVIGHGGSVVKGLGDGILATFPGAAEAVGAGVAMQRALQRRNRRENWELAIRVGISAGDLSHENGDCFGTPVVEASRLCAAAIGGQILVAEVVRLLCGTRGGHSFETIGALELKGLAAPVTAWQVDWTDTDDLAAPAELPSGLSTEGQFPFVARLAEREVTAKALKQALNGDRRTVLIAGEPGIGKTRLCAETAREAAAEGGVVLFGRCDEELGIPFQPFVEALRWYLANTDVSDLGAALGPGAGELVRLVPELAELVPGLAPATIGDPDVERARLFDAVVGWLGAAGDDALVVLVLDDLHWAGRPTLQLLRHLVRAAQRTRLLVLGTYRDTDLSRSHPLADVLADLRRAPTVERVHLSGLDRSGVQAFMEAAAGHNIGVEDSELVERIHGETDGNPFFVNEMLFHLGESGAVYQGSDGRWRVSVGDISVPEGVREVVGRRVSRLSDAANTVLSVAAVIGQQFELSVLDEVCDLSPDDIEAALQEAVVAGLMREQRGARISYRFSHALVRSTLSEELSTARRVRLHRRTAEAIETVHRSRLEDHVVALANHYSEAAASGEVDQAIHYCRLAALHALDQVALDEAVTWYSRAVELLGTANAVDPRLDCELRIELGDAMFRTGDPAHRQLLLDAGDQAHRLGAVDLVVRAATASNHGASYTSYGSVDAEKVSAMERALCLCASDVDRARLSTMLAGELMFSGQSDRVTALIDDAIGLARNADADDVFVDAAVAKCGFCWGPENLVERLALMAEVTERADRLGTARARTFAVARFYPLIESGDVTAGARAALAGIEAAEAVKEP